MIPLGLGVDSVLKRAGRRWGRLRFSGQLALLGSALSASLLLLGIAIWRGWVRQTWVAALLLVLLLLGAGIAFLVLAISAAISQRPRPWLARQLEYVHRPFQDRLNTLTSMHPTAPQVAAYFQRIEEQASDRVAGVDLGAALPAAPSLRRWALCAVLALGTVLFYQWSRPWSRLEAWKPAESEPATEPNLKLPAPESAAEVKTAWGEVRITEPGRDLKVTKVDVVALQIEAASSETLEKATWVTSAAGTKKAHQLPAPPEPHYAVYKPLLYVDELRLSDWDVVTYFASAATDQGRSYGSDLYFLEVRPFREDILKLPGGEAGKAYRFLGDLTALIDRQKQVIRETHGFELRSYERPELRAQDRAKLAQAEADLAAAARHLYARIATEMENQDVAVVLDQLAQAEDLLERARAALSAPDAPALAAEQEALAALVAARKKLQKAITDHPEAFGEPGEQAEEPGPMAGLEDKLKQISEFRNEAKAARELLDRVVDEQRRLAKQAETADAERRAALAAEQERLRRSLQEFAQDRKPPFKGAQKELQEADQAQRAAGDALGHGTSPETAATQKRAVAALEGLRRAVAEQTEDRRLAQAYALRKMLETEAKALEQVEGAPDEHGTQEARRLAEEARETTRELKKVVEEPAVRESFGLPLRQALSPQRQQERETRLDSLGQAESEEARKEAAGAARRSLQQLGQAFDQSQPELVRAQRGQDPLKGSAEEALERGLRALEGMTAEAGKSRSPEDQDKQKREALLHLREGVLGLYGKTQRSARLLLEVENELNKKDLKVDASRLKKLLEQIEQFRVEMSDQRLARSQQPDLRHIDLSRVPPAYRDRIQRYFQKLSEQPQ